MLRLISFGSGSSGNSYYLEADGGALLIDSGVGIRTLKKYIREYGITTTNIRALIITHDHADHIKSAGCVADACHLPVFATREVHKGILVNYATAHKIPSELACAIETGKPRDMFPFRVTAFPVPHDSTDCVGYQIEVGGETVVLVTDCGHITPEIGRHIGQADYLLIEANHDEQMLIAGPYPEHLKQRILGPTGHTSNKACGEAIVRYAGEKLKRVWLCHLSEENNHPELARKTVETIIRGAGFTATVEVMRRKCPTGPFELS